MERVHKDQVSEDNNRMGLFTIGHWRLWLMANGDFTLGTFIQLLDNGAINRVTWHEDGSETVFCVKEPEGWRGETL
jgi:hypothetical protein|tara:strand:- start:3799 stop:4026 length:228 start_codon:yes stop_codon:yes gene_type:complete